MPNDPGATTWLGAQYQRFLDGVDKLGPNHAPRLARSQAKVRVDPGKDPAVSIPAWSDIIKLGPRTTVTDEDWTIQRHYERAHLPSPLAPEIQDEIKARREMGRRMRNSAIPEYQEGVTTMLTAIDNVQDAALTASVGTRVAMPILGKFGTWLAPAVLGLASIARLLNWLNLGVFAFGVLYALACKGPKQAVAQASVPALAGFAFKGVRAVLPRMQGIPHAPPGQTQKGLMAAMMYGSPEGRALTNVRGSRWARMRITFGEALQAAQVASDLTGYGLSLGAIMGFVSESTYGAARASMGEKVHVRSPEVNHVFQSIIGPRVAQLGRGALWHHEQCARALAAAPFILRDPEAWGDELYALTWLVVYTSVEPLMWDTYQLRWRERVIDHLPAAWTPWDARDPVTRGIVEGLSMDPDRPGPWPLPGSPRELTTEKLVLEIGPEMSRALMRWLYQAPDDPLRRFVAELSLRVTERLWYWLEGHPYFPDWQLSPSTAVWESMWRDNRWPIISDAPELIAAAWAASEQYVIDTGRKYIDTPELDRIWQEHGTPLLRILGDGAAVPIEHLVPWDLETGASTDVAFGTSYAEARARLETLLAEQKKTPPPA